MSKNHEGNFVKISRSLLYWGWYTNVNTKCLFLHCILNANWKPGDFQGIHCQRGQFISSIEKLSQQTGLTIQQVRTALKHLESTGEITRRATSKFSIITVKNYDRYQSDNRETGKQTANRPQTSNTQPNKPLTTIEEGKEGNKKEKKEKNLAAPQICPSGDAFENDGPVDLMEVYYQQMGEW